MPLKELETLQNSVWEQWEGEDLAFLCGLSRRLPLLQVSFVQDDDMERPYRLLTFYTKSRVKSDSLQGELLARCGVSASAWAAFPPKIDSNCFSIGFSQAQLRKKELFTSAKMLSSFIAAKYADEAILPITHKEPCIFDVEEFLQQKEMRVFWDVTTNIRLFDIFTLYCSMDYLLIMPLEPLVSNEIKPTFSVSMEVCPGRALELEETWKAFLKGYSTDAADVMQCSSSHISIDIREAYEKLFDPLILAVELDRYVGKLVNEEIIFLSNMTPVECYSPSKFPFFKNLKE